jgi:ferredoxin
VPLRIEEMRVTVDEDVCVASGQCEMICPEVFEVDVVSVVRVEQPDPSLHEQVRDAADSCPTGAILVQED